MRKTVILPVLLSLFLSIPAPGAENIYTWRDEQGILNITDQPPPAGAEILDVSPSRRNEAEQLQRARMKRLEQIRGEQERARIREQLLRARQTEKEALQAAEAAKQQADLLFSRAERTQNKERNRRIRRQALNQVDTYNQAMDRAENARHTADILEEQLRTKEARP
ncbi:MAG: hypothetical protein Kow0089_07260 [Desulfobulbaceae bacterium]